MPTRRNRRGKQEVRDLILDAARTLFVEHGFRGVSTRDIAARADVVEVVIYSNFGSKAKLFDDAVINPADSALAEFIEHWTPIEARPGESERMSACLSALYDTLQSNREVIGAMMAAQAHDAELANRLRRRLHQLVTTVLDNWSKITSTEPRRRASVEVAIGAVLATVIHGNLLHSGGDTAARAVLREQLDRFLVGDKPCTVPT